VGMLHLQLPGSNGVMHSDRLWSSLCGCKNMAAVAGVDGSSYSLLALPTVLTVQ